jgi:hypothetical protein
MSFILISSDCRNPARAAYCSENKNCSAARETARSVLSRNLSFDTMTTNRMHVHSSPGRAENINLFATEDTEFTEVNRQQTFLDKYYKSSSVYFVASCEKDLSRFQVWDKSVSTFKAFAILLM